MFHLISIVVASLYLSGCVAVPPAVVIGGYALDGASYAATGKTMSDHAISGVADKDCSLWRVVEGTRVCQHYADDVHGGGGGQAAQAAVGGPQGFAVTRRPGPSLDPTPVGAVQEVAPDPQAWAAVERTVGELRRKLGHEANPTPDGSNAATTSAWPFRAPD